MDIKAIVPWKTRIPAAGYAGFRGGKSWIWRQLHRNSASASPLKEDDLDHLGSLHRTMGHGAKR